MLSYISVVLAFVLVYLYCIERNLTRPPRALAAACRKLKCPGDDDQTEPDILPHLPARTGLRYVVTGGCGLTGSWIARHLLLRGESHVRLLDLRDVPADLARRCQFSRVDISDAAAVHAAFAQPWSDESVGVDVVFHTAGSIRFWERLPWQKRRSFAVLIDGTRHVLAAARAAGCRKLVYTSSGSVVLPPTDWLDPRPLKALCLNDDSTIYGEGSGTSHYCAGKAAAEQLVLDTDDGDDHKEGMRTGVIRPAHAIFGSGGYSAGLTWRAGFNPRSNTETVYNMLYVENLSLACLRLESYLGGPPSRAVRGERALFTVADDLCRVGDIYDLQQAHWPAELGIFRPRPLAPILMACYFAELYLRLHHFLTGKELDLGQARYLLPPSWSTGQRSIHFDTTRARDVLRHTPVFTVAQGVLKSCRLEREARDNERSIDKKEYFYDDF